MTHTMTLTELIEECLLDGWAEKYTEHTAAKLMADHLIANGVTFAEDTNVPAKWIPASEPPKEEGEYIVAYNGAAESFAAWFCDDRNVWFLLDDGNWFEIEIDWWMPFPEPPKGVE